MIVGVEGTVMNETITKSIKVGVIIPAYREQGRIGSVIRRVMDHVPDVVVIDDGSGDGTAVEAEALGVVVLRHTENQGKGMALNTGFAYMREQGFDVVLTLDADGQHNPDDVPRFLEAYRRTGIPVLIGNRMKDTSRMPVVRRLTNRFMSWLLSRELRQFIPDTQCGFRLYACDILPPKPVKSPRYAAESEILLNLADRGIRMDSVPISTIYRDEKSKINPWTDTLRFFKMLRRHRRERSRVGQPRKFEDD
jgi:glycosyltransferase involved in cell wall biosynthesis